jgi:hypothetical protein
MFFQLESNLMKKSILALGALAVVGGLGLAGSAQAVMALSVPGITEASAPNSATDGTTFDLDIGSTGHELIVPYYTVQGPTDESSMATLITLINTDGINGKAVKVRFRGAANSDDVLDFTVLMSPSDVWTAKIAQDTDGSAYLNSTDTTCTIPQTGFNGKVKFITGRFPDYMTPTEKNMNTREGYIEILNMADIPPRIWSKTTKTVTVKNPLWTAIKHVNGRAPCYGLWNTNGNSTNDFYDVDPIVALFDNINQRQGVDLSADYGLHSPTGGLQGGWMLINTDTLAQYSGNDTAIRAWTPPDAAGIRHNATTDVMFMPQISVFNQEPFRGYVSGGTKEYTADPLLTGSRYHDPGTTPLAQTLFYDLPDLSTPMAASVPGSNNTPSKQARALAAVLAHGTISNEFINNASGAVPMSTDWILSQTTRRYFAVVNYADSRGASTIVYNDACTSDGEPACLVGGINKLSLPYAGSMRPGTFAPTADRHPGTGILVLDKNHDYGPQACLQKTTLKFTDREESATAVVPDFSPGTATDPLFCGEVATLTWGNSPTLARLTNTRWNDTTYQTGWGTFTFNPGSDGGLNNADGAANVPVAGYAAQSMTDGRSRISFGVTYPHRW